MTKRAFFGPPRDGFTPGGTHITVYIVPVWQGRLVAYDVSAEQARGRWLPWNVLDFRQNPYEGASRLTDDWCHGLIDDLALVDVMSFPSDRGGWEIALVFRAELSAEPRGDDVRTPFLFPAGRFDAIGLFDPVDLERWVGARRSAAGEEPPSPPREPMVF